MFCCGDLLVDLALIEHGQNADVGAINEHAFFLLINSRLIAVRCHNKPPCYSFAPFTVNTNGRVGAPCFWYSSENALVSMCALANSATKAGCVAATQSAKNIFRLRVGESALSASVSKRFAPRCHPHLIFTLSPTCTALASIGQRCFNSLSMPARICSCSSRLFITARRSTVTCANSGSSIWTYCTPAFLSGTGIFALASAYAVPRQVLR